MRIKNDIFALIRGKIGAIFLSGLFLSAVSFLFLVLNEKNFKVNSDFLIVQNATASQDAYSLSKSAEYFGKVLSESVYSELFINEVVKTGKVNAEFLPFDKKEKIKVWSKIVSASQNTNLGIVNIKIFDDNQKQAVAISEGVSEVLTTKNSLFRGEGQNIEVKVLSGPIVEKNPSILDIMAVILGGFLFGFLLSVVLVYYKSEQEKIENSEYFPRNEDYV
ncbi:MAG: hypothetical protein ACD_11C00020G0061 [uncultured bacterium]|nr:MAG: hypothetical protein ACD_11C00020G0061 [uncultured bacterium]HBR71348.1 hypothetical protein [Candidatus Moranbacteria bacterium]